MKQLQAVGVMGDLDDGPYQEPLETSDVQQAILDLLPKRNFDIIVTHAPQVEYTRHRRHEETSMAVLNL